MVDRVPIDGCNPAVFFFRKGHNPIDQQFIQLALIIQIIRIQSKDQSLAQLNLLLREIFYGSITVQPDAALGVCVVEVRVDLWLHHVFSIHHDFLAGLGMVGVSKQLASSGVKPIRVA
jgi:hypothetical protein